MANERKDINVDDDKSINELLKEYADDVKDQNLDDFLKNDDAFEGDNDDASEDEDKVLADPAPKKSGAFLTILMTVIAFGAAGAGAYMYLNRNDEGMTSIMGGFGGNGSDNAEMDLDLPPPPEAPTVFALPTPPTPEQPVLNESPTMPAPIMNEAPLQPALDVAPIVTSEAPAPGADLLAVPQTQNPAPIPAETTSTEPSTDTASASKAVDDWAAGLNDGMAEVENKLPEQVVEEIKAKPPVTAKAKKTATAAPEKKVQTTASVSSKADGALPPPYVAIQAKKGESATPSPKIASKSKMAPVVEGRVSAPASSDRNINEADVSKATGSTAAMVAQGGGVIPLGSYEVPAPVGMMPVARPSTPMAVVPLAIKGGKSIPPGTARVETRTYAALPATNQGTLPARAMKAPASEPQGPAVPVEEVKQVRATPPQMTETSAPEVSSAPPASSAQDARAILAQAMQAEKAGQMGDALELYQKALEVDAIYADGTSIDRGMVYDRIGAIRAGS